MALGGIAFIVGLCSALAGYYNGDRAMLAPSGAYRPSRCY